MLQLYDKSKIKIEGLTKYKDYNIESVLSTGDKTLSFSYPAIYADNIQEEGYIRTQDAEFVIKEIEDQVEWKTIKVVLNVEDLEGKAWDRFDSTEQTITNCLNLALVGTGWTIGTCTVTKLRTVRKTCCSSWDIIQEARKVYRAEMEFDTLNKKINIAAQLGSDKGCYFIDSLNLKALTIQRNSYDYYTRIIAEGKDGLVLVAPGYLENYQYSNKIKTFYWKDERYTDLESLTEDAGLKLDEVSKPYRAYSASVQDLANSSDAYKDILGYSLGDTVTLISKDMKVKEKQRIVKITEYPEEPERNTCEIANATLTFEDVQKEQQDTTDTVNNITEDDGTVSEGAIRTAVEHITIIKADVQDLNAVTIRVGTLESTSATITLLNVTNASITNLQSSKANVIDLTAATGRITTLETNSATITQLDVTNGNITNLTSQVASINTLLAGNIGANNLAVGAIQAGSGIIANAAIASAQIISLDLIKLNAGTISTNKFVVQSDSGNLKIQDNAIKLWDAAGKERVSLGLNGADYNLLVRGPDGTTVLFGIDGVTKAGITTGAVDDSKVDANANISGTKLNISSVVSSINNGTTTLLSSKISLNSSTLDVQFSNLNSTVTSLGTSVTSQASSISVLQGQITTKVSQTDINASIGVNVNGTNLVVNGDFSNGTTGWATVFCSLSALNNEATMLATAQNGRAQRPTAYPVGNKIYRRADIKATSNLVGIGRANTRYKNHSGGGQYEMLSAINVADSTAYYSIIDGRSSGWDNIYIKNIVEVDITALFGAGNEPTQAWCDANIAFSSLSKNAQTQIDAATTRITTTETSITQLNSSITLKANQTDLNTTNTNVSGLTARMTTAESTLTVQAGQISSKVSITDMATQITQNASSVKIALDSTDGAGKVKTSCFEVTDAHARFTSADGSYTEFVPATTGLKWHSGATNYDYHYLMYTGIVTVHSGAPVTITLPVEFKNKTFKVVTSINNVDAGVDCALSELYNDVSAINSAAGTFVISGYAWVISIPDGLDSTSSLTVSYMVTA